MPCEEGNPVGTSIAVRGWLECDRHQLAAVQTIIAAQDEGFYSGGWATQRQQFNWTYYVFYGGDIRESGRDWMLGQLREIAAVPAGDEDGDRVRGLFFASHEVDGMSEWRISDGELTIAAGDPKYEYLDGLEE
jgi:hypothetical protein